MFVFFVLSAYWISCLQSPEAQGAIVFLEEPQTMVICECRSVIFCCRFSGTDAVPTWYINERNFNWKSIEEPHNLIWFANGQALSIDRVHVDMNLTTYQCGFPTAGSVRSAKGTLYVAPSTAAECDMKSTYSDSIEEVISDISVPSSSYSHSDMTSSTDMVTYPSLSMKLSSSNMQVSIAENGFTVTPNYEFEATNSTQHKSILIISVTIVITTLGMMLTMSIVLALILFHWKRHHSVLKEKSKVSDPIYEEVQAREITNISTNQSYGKMEQIEMISNECYSTVFNHEL